MGYGGWTGTGSTLRLNAAKVTSPGTVYQLVTFTTQGSCTSFARPDAFTVGDSHAIYAGACDVPAGMYYATKAAEIILEKYDTQAGLYRIITRDLATSVDVVPADGHGPAVTADGSTVVYYSEGGPLKVLTVP